MKKMNKFWSAAIVGALLCVMLQSCASSRNKYGCPERIQSPVSILSLK